MAARLLAREQNVALYQIGLSAVVSKYVAETEKNLGKLFVGAGNAYAALFFDEADALLGKRGEIDEALGRRANLEVDYLLRPTEEFEGVVILTTNLRTNIDEAFLRRQHSIVECPAPDAGARERIFLCVFPSSLQCSSNEEFALPGCGIRNVVIHPAYRAVADVGDADD